MDYKQIFDKYYKRLAHESMLKAGLIGAIIGFAVAFGIALGAAFLTENNWLWILAIGVGVLLGVGSALLLYYKVFRPDPVKIAKRLDETMGLQERLVTMVQFEKDESFMAQSQRDDAKQSLNKVDPKSVKIAVAKSLIAIACVVGVLGISMTTVSALVANDVMEPIQNIFPQEPTEEDYRLVIFEVDDEEMGQLECEGEIDGTFEEYGLVGFTTRRITAVPKDGYVFLSWDDGDENPEKFVDNVQEDMFFLASFVELEGSGGGGMVGDGTYEETDEEGDPDEMEELPEKPEVDSSQSSENEKPKDDDDSESDPDAEDGEMPPYSGRPSHQVDDGATPFFDIYSNYSEEALRRFLECGDLSDEEKAMIESVLRWFESNTESAGSSNP